jgi:hypothetical protein
VIPRAPAEPTRRAPAVRTGSARLPAVAISVPEALVGAAVLVVATVAWCSLLLADFHAHSLPAVAAGSVAVLAALGGVARFFGGRLRLYGDRATLVVLAIIGGLAGWMFFPGYHYGATDKDPGVYVAHGIAIAQTGSYSFHDEVLARVPGVISASPGARWPGVWVHDLATSTIVPQFYHLWPSLLGTAYDLGGWGALSAMTPLMSLLSVLALVVAVRRAFNLPTAALAGLLVATNMLQVWQAKYPTTESLAQLLFIGSLLGVVVALDTGWRPAAGLAGLLLGIGWLNRADTLLLIFVVTGVAAVLIVARRFDGRCWWFAAGFAVTAPHALWQAYAGARAYTIGNLVPDLPKVATVVLGLLAVAVVLRYALRRPAGGVVRLLRDPIWQRRLGLLVCVGAFALLVLGFLRPRLFGEGYINYPGRVLRSYDEQSLRRLSWFFTLPGFALMGLGIAVVALRRWSATAWALLIPFLLIFPVYAYKTRNSTRLMWWSRRYAPIVSPEFLVLVAVAIGFALMWRFRGRAWLRVPAILSAAALVAVFLGQSLPLRSHDEFGGAYALSARMARLSGGAKGVFLFQQGSCCFSPSTLLGAGLWLERDQYSALLPRDPAMFPAYVAKFERAFPDSPVFLVVGDADAATKPPDGLSLRPVQRVRTTLPFWEESDVHRPSEPLRPPLAYTVWRVAGT